MEEKILSEILEEKISITAAEVTDIRLTQAGYGLVICSEKDDI